MTSGLSLIQRITQRGMLAELDAVLFAVDMTAADLLGRRRTTRHVEARRAFYHRLRAAGLSYPAIGYLVGRDHTTVLHACRVRP